MGGDILAFSNLLILCMNFMLQSNILILDSLYLLFKILYIIIKLSKCCILFLNGLPMFFLDLAFKLLLNMRRQHIAVAPLEVFFCWLLTAK